MQALWLATRLARRRRQQQVINSNGNEEAKYTQILNGSSEMDMKNLEREYATGTDDGWENGREALNEWRMDGERIIRMGIEALTAACGRSVLDWNFASWDNFSVKLLAKLMTTIVGKLLDVLFERGSGKKRQPFEL